MLLTTLFNTNKILNPCQFKFLKVYSTHDALIIYHCARVLETLRKWVGRFRNDDFIMNRRPFEINCGYFYEN